MSVSFLDSPGFWDPLWRRFAVLIIALVWVYVEWRANSVILMAIGCLLTGQVIYEFFLSGNYPKSRRQKEPNQRDGI